MSIITKNTVDGNLAEALLASFSECPGDGVKYAVAESFPEIAVTTTTGRFPIYARENALQTINAVKAPGALPAEVNVYTREGVWNAQHISLSAIVPDGNNVFGFSAHEGAVQTLWQKIWAFKEAVAANLLFGASVPAISTSGNLRNDVSAAKQAVYAATGLVPNALICSYPVYLKLLNSADFLALFPGAAMLTEQDRANALPAAFGLSRLIVSTAAASAENAPDDVATINSILPNNQFCVAVVAPQGSALSVPSAGRTFKVLNDSGRTEEIVSVYDPQRAATIHTVHMVLDIKLIDPKMAVRITGV
jgi:hypothetical protein